MKDKEKKIIEILGTIYNKDGIDALFKYLANMPKDKVTQKAVKKFFMKNPMIALDFYDTYLHTHNPIEIKKRIKEIDEEMERLKDKEMQEWIRKDLGYEIESDDSNDNNDNNNEGDEQ
ncbi:MAG: hypothetical protein QW578_05990 [Thermoplasmatales archaeon]